MKLKTLIEDNFSLVKFYMLLLFDDFMYLVFICLFQ